MIEKKANTVLDRLNSPTPDFWKRVRFYAQIGSVITSVALSIAVPVSAPLWVMVGLGALDTLFATTIVQSSLTTKDKKLSEKPTKPNKVENKINKLVTDALKKKVS